ncbi:MAG TPA: type II secretion system F family protein [Mycobacteriales bacterium]|nr:type II secretion system F family protein [Mycobacteriales bacterium]
MIALLAAGAAALGVVLVLAGMTRTETAQAVPAGAPEDLDTFRAGLSASLDERLLSGIGGLAERLVRRLTPSDWHERLQERIRLAGLEVSLAPQVVYVGKVVGAIVGVALLGGVALVLAVPAPAVVAMLLLGLAGGFVAPDVVLGRRADDRQADIRRTLPEALDLMAISVQAGVGLEQAVTVVTERLQGALGEELTRFLNEVQLGFSRRDALQNLRDRNTCPELSTFVLSLLQADALGIAIGDVLKTQATEMRAKRRQRARERAAKAPVRLLFPLVFGILPALFIVILGPAAIQFGGSFK